MPAFPAEMNLDNTVITSPRIAAASAITISGVANVCQWRGRIISRNTLNAFDHACNQIHIFLGEGANEFLGEQRTNLGSCLGCACREMVAAKTAFVRFCGRGAKLFHPNFGGVPVAPDRPCWVSSRTGLKLFASIQP